MTVTVCVGDRSEEKITSQGREMAEELKQTPHMVALWEQAG